MSYDLMPRNKKVEEMSFNQFIWPQILEVTGMGFVIGYGKGLRPSRYVFYRRKDASPVSNDGFPVSAFEAKCMSRMAYFWVSCQRHIWEEFEKLSSEDQEYMKNKQEHYNTPWAKDWIDLVEKFADFAEKSSGFKIH